MHACELLMALCAVVCRELENRFHSMKDDLITRLQNACAQRDEARAQVGDLKGFSSEAAP